MSFSVDRFMQVKCRFQLTSETESSESIHVNNERIRLCTSVDFDKNSTLIVMICSNESGSNHIIAYHIERKLHTYFDCGQPEIKVDYDEKSSSKFLGEGLTFSQLAQQHSTNYQVQQQRSLTATKSEPQIIVKHIYYHNYNEDIVAICLSETGNKLALVNASSTIYVIPIKNILLNLHSKQLRSSQGNSMYFYDASIVDCCTLSDPVAVAFWESLETENKSTVIVANEKGELSFISVEGKRELHRTSINERIKHMGIIRDRFSYSLLITCDSFRQYRFTLELVKQQEYAKTQTPSSSSINHIYNDEYIYLERDIMPSWDRRPVQIKLQNSGNLAMGGGSAAVALQRVLGPSSRSASQLSLFSNSRDRSLPLILTSSGSMISVVDVLGAQRPQGSRGRLQNGEPRLLRFFSNKQFYYRPQKPLLVCKLTSLDPDEQITHLVLTDRFLAITTDRNRCLINSRNCCNLRNSSHSIDLDPVVKEISFNKDETIQMLLKSPVPNDQDNIIDSFLLVTNRSIYSVEARQSCRDMFIALIDAHLCIKPSKSKHTHPSKSLTSLSTSLCNEYTLLERCTSVNDCKSNLAISSFLSHRDDTYERICYDSRAFSILFKLELNSLYEAYGDRLLLRKQFGLAERFFQMAKFDHIKILGKYIRLGAYGETIEYVTSVIRSEDEILDEKERMDMAKVAIDCYLAKTIIERCKMSIYGQKLDRNDLKKLLEHSSAKNSPTGNSPYKRRQHLHRQSNHPNNSNKPYPLQLCEHSPRGQGAKLSTNTIVIDDCNDDEATMTTDLMAPSHNKGRLECERAFMAFINKFMPPSLYSYVLTQLVDFNLIDLASDIAQSDARIYMLIKILLRTKNENRLIFREARYERLAERLSLLSDKTLVRINDSNPKFLQFITSPQVTKAFVKNISLSSEYLGYRQTLLQFRKYSYVALCQFESFRHLVNLKRDTRPNGCDPQANIFSSSQKRAIENIFVQFLRGCLDESTDDSCRLWYNYVNFYLNYMGTVEELEKDVLNLLESDCRDCRFAITLYKSIAKDEPGSAKPFVADGIANTPLELMSKLYNLSEVFNNEFLMQMLEKTLQLVPLSSDLEALSDCLGVDCIVGQVPLPVENVWRQILKTIHPATLTPRPVSTANYPIVNNDT